MYERLTLYNDVHRIHPIDSRSNSSSLFNNKHFVTIFARNYRCKITDTDPCMQTSSISCVYKTEWEQLQLSVQIKPSPLESMWTFTRVLDMFSLEIMHECMLLY